jgi:hypothetical protein
MGLLLPGPVREYKAIGDGGKGISREDAKDVKKPERRPIPPLRSSRHDLGPGAALFSTCVACGYSGTISTENQPGDPAMPTVTCPGCQRPISVADNPMPPTIECLACRVRFAPADTAKPAPKSRSRAWLEAAGIVLGIIVVVGGVLAVLAAAEYPPFDRKGYRGPQASPGGSPAAPGPGAAAEKNEGPEAGGPDQK